MSTHRLIFFERLASRLHLRMLCGVAHLTATSLTLLAWLTVSRTNSAIFDQAHVSTSD